MSDQTYLLLCFLGISVAVIFQLMRDLKVLRNEVRHAARGLVARRSPRFYFSRSNEIWRSLVLLLRGRRRVELEGREVLSEILSFGSRIAQVSYARTQLIDEVVRLLFERAGSDIVFLAVVIREHPGVPLQVERVEGLPQSRIETPLLMAFDELLDGAGAGWGYHSFGDGGGFDFSAFGVDLSLAVPLRDSEEICGGVWLGFRKGSQTLSAQRRAFIEGIAQHAAATFHASQQIEERARVTLSERDFLLGMSHDLRAPGHSALFALSDVLSGECGELQPDQAERLRVIDSALREQMDLLGDVLDFAKLQRGHLDIVPGFVRLLPCVERVVRSLEPATRRTGVAIEIDVEPSSCVKADARHVERILWNLLSNAIKYAPNGKVSVEVVKRGEVLELLVIDSGIGVPVAERGKLFTQFGRLSNSQNSPGVGLGLTLVKALTEQNGGEVFYRPGQVCGSVFGIRLPLARVVDSQGFEKESEIQRPMLQTIVVIDDDPASCRTVMRMLRGSAKRVVPAGGVAEAVELCQALRPDAIVSDYYLADGTAADLFERLREAKVTLSGVVLTGSSAPELRELLRGSFGVITIEKPASPESIIDALSAAAADLAIDNPDIQLLLQ